MKKGLIGAYQLGVLEGLSESLRIASKITGQQSIDFEGIFYATAFQAGVDEFIIPEFKDKPVSKSEFILKRTRYLKRKESAAHYRLISDAFAAYLPAGWERNEEFSAVWPLSSFLAELLDAMSVGASVLSPWGVPNIDEVEDLLPSELFIPLKTLIASISEVHAASPIPIKAIPTENVQRFNDLMSGNVFLKYTAAQVSLEDSTIPVAATLPSVISSGKRLVSRNRHLLRLRNSSMGVLQLTPRVVDTVFGKLPGTLAEAFVTPVIRFLEARRRIVIYDFRNSVHDVMLSNLLRMLKTTQES